jgi:hypothetical protein
MAEDFEVGGTAAGQPSNRPFMIAVIAIAALLLLSIICLGLYALVLAPRQRVAHQTEVAQILQFNATRAAQMTATDLARWISSTPTNTEAPTETPAPTNTEVVVIPTETPSLDPLTQTAAAAAQMTLSAQQTLWAQQTMAAQALPTGTPTVAPPTPTATALPATGFADEAGIPGLLLMGAALVAVIFVARRLRTHDST